MSSIDERIVRMKFDNQAFEQGIARTRDSLGRFTKQLETPTSGKGLDGISTAITKVRDGLGRFASESTKDFSQVDEASKKVSMEGLSNGISAVADKFKALSVVGITALATITSRAVSAGLQFAKSFTFAPINDGFHEYETNLNSIQTILANTQASGAKLKDVENALQDLNHYSDQTIYNFSEMAKNIGTFTAAGVDLKTSAASIKGIANLAALSGSNSEQASGAMYQLSQAISSGRVSLEDWNSVVNAGMGGTVFQRALAQTAEKMGTLSDGAVKLSGKMKNVTINGKSFRESITAKPGQDSWLSSKVLTATLQQFTGDLSDAQLKAQGFSKAQIKAIQAQAKTAKEAATQVKTLTQLFDTTKEALGSGWSQTFQTIFGDFTEAKGLFTGISNSIGKVVSNSSNARNKMLADWKKLGGRDNLISGITNGVKAFASVIKPIHDAFRQIFPATTGKQLADMTKQFRDFTAKLKIGSDTADKLKRTFAGVFAVFGIAFDIIKGVVGVIFDLVGVAAKGSGGFLNFTAKIGDFLVALRTGIRDGEGFKNFFKGLSAVLAVPIKLVQKLAGFLGSLFKSTDSKAFEKNVEGASAALSPLGHLGEVISKVWAKVLTIMENVGNFFQNLGGRISQVFSNLGIDFATMFEGFDFKTLFAGLDTGLLAGLFLVIKKFLGGLGENGPMEFLQGFRDTLEGLTGTLTGMQNALKAATLLQIALAIGVLAVSMNILSKIDAEGLARASSAITVMFAQLLGSLAVFQKFIGAADFAKLPFVMGSLILLAGAVLILTQAVKQLSGLNWNELAKGLTGVTVLLGGLFAVMKFMPPSSGMISTGLGLIVLAGAIKILASAVGDLSGLSWNELAKGLVGVGAVLGSLILFTKFAKADAGGIAQGAGILLLAVGIKILASAVSEFSQLSWANIASGLVAMAGALAIIVAALMFIPPTAPLAAAGVLVVATSLGMVAKALAKMAKMSWAEIGSSLTVMLGALSIIAAALYVIPPTAPLAAAGVLLVAISLQQIAKVLSGFAEYSWEEIGKSMTLLAGTMGIIAGAMLVMSGAIPGAAATIIIAAALKILAPVLQQFAAMSMAEIGKSLLMLAGVFVVFGAAALLLAPVIPLMIGLAAAVTLLGIGLLAAGAGVFLFATGLTVLAAAGAAGAAAVIGIVAGLIGLIPKLMEEIGLGIIAFAAVIAKSGPAITKAITVVLLALIEAIAVLTPKIVQTLYKLLVMLLNTLAKYVPKMVDAGLRLLTGILQGIANNIGKVVTAASNVIVGFLNGISKNLSKVIQAGVNLIIQFINGVTKAIDSNSGALGQAGGRLAVAIVKGMVKGLAAGSGEIASAARSVASSALNAAKDFLGIHSPSKEFEKVGNYVNDGFRKGLDGNKGQIDEVFKAMADKLKALAKSAKVTGKERKKAAAAYNLLSKSFKDEHALLGKLANKYDQYTEKIKNAKQALEDLKKTRNDFKKQIADQYSVLPDISSDTSVAGYESDLKTQIEKTKQFANTLQRLRDLGLNDEAYKQLLSKGIDALPFANQILAGGKDAVNEINSLDSQLAAAAKALGGQASGELYDAAVQAAAGFVKGLELQRKAIENEMDKIADAMVKAIMKKLGIKSPSRVFMKIGGYSAEGVAKGLNDMSGVVEKAASDTGQIAIDSLTKSLSGFSDLITGPIDIQPTITPVLDLSGIKKGASQIGSILPTQSVSVDSSYAKAKSIASEWMSMQETTAANSDYASKTVNYTQNNYSPKALAAAEIYRRSNNQISKLKKDLED